MCLDLCPHTVVSGGISCHTRPPLPRLHHSSVASSLSSGLWQFTLGRSFIETREHWAKTLNSLRAKCRHLFWFLMRLDRCIQSEIYWQHWKSSAAIRNVIVKGNYCSTVKTLLAPFFIFKYAGAWKKWRGAYPAVSEVLDTATPDLPPLSIS